MITLVPAPFVGLALRTKTRKVTKVETLSPVTSSEIKAFSETSVPIFSSKSSTQMSASFRFTLRMDATASLRFLRPVAWHRPMSFLSWSWGGCCDDPWGANICAGTSMDQILMSSHWCRLVSIWCRLVFGAVFLSFRQGYHLSNTCWSPVKRAPRNTGFWRAAASTCGKRPGLSELATRLTSAFCGLPRRGTTP